jgi:hypothetical protein
VRESHATSSTSVRTQPQDEDGKVFCITFCGCFLIAWILTDVPHRQAYEPTVRIERAGNVFTGINNGEKHSVCIEDMKLICTLFQVMSLKSQLRSTTFFATSLFIQISAATSATASLTVERTMKPTSDN